LNASFIIIVLKCVGCCAHITTCIIVFLWDGALSDFDGIMSYFFA